MATRQEGEHLASGQQVKPIKVSRWSAPPTKAGRSEERLGWLLTFPALLVIVLVAFYPLYETFRMSFTNLRATRTNNWRYVGFDNYTRLFQDNDWLQALQNTFAFTLVSVGLETILGMIVALTIHSNFRGRGVVRTSMLVPWAIPTVVSSLLWTWMLNDRFGIINYLFIWLGFDQFQNFNWVGKPSTALWSVVAVDVWKTTPFMALLLLAGLQVIPDDVYEASRVDGASKWQQYWQITLPLLKPAILVALIFRTMASFRVFDIIFIMKSYATETMSVAVYAQRELMAQQKWGYGSAAAVVIFLCLAILVFLYTRMIKIEEQ